MSEEWGPWIDGSIPPPVVSYVQMDCIDLKGRGDMTHECVVLGFEGEQVRISPGLPARRQWQLDQYRIRKPRGLTILENMIANLPAPLLPRVASGDAILPSGIAAPSALAPNVITVSATSPGLRAGGFSSHPRQKRAIRPRSVTGSPKRSSDDLIPTPQQDALPSVRVFTAPGPAGVMG